MGNSFVLFDVSMEIILEQFHSGKIGYTQKLPLPWANATGNSASVTTANVY